MSFIVDPTVEQYAEEHSSPEGELFHRLAAETREKSSAPQMMVGLLEGRFLGLLVRTLRARRVLELGTFTGYSSISMALALPPDGRVITCDVDEEAIASGTLAAMRRTAATAPGMSGGDSPYRASIRATMASLISSGVPGTPSTSAM